MKYLSILQEYWGYSDFRGIQRDIIESIGAGRDTLGLMPTGGGKSITFQVPALAQEGICIVVSPLVALMKDQVSALRRKGIKATAVYTGMTHEEVLIALENCIYGNFKFLYISPERLGSELFQVKLSHMHVSFIAVDEAHCISQWGYDFRPAYTQLARIRQLVPSVPVLALTATATPAVVEDIQRQLRFRQTNVCRMSFERSNLAYSVRRFVDSKAEAVGEVLALHPGSAIVYTRSRRLTQELAEWLTASGVTATFFHAGLTNREKNERAAAWQRGDIRVIVATNAFGMGIDKPDVRVVVHADVPDSPEAYFQEAGRAGRDGQPAAAVLLYDNRTAGLLRRRIDETFPPADYVAKVYEDVCFFLQMGIGDGEGVTRNFDLQDFCIHFHHYATRAYNALQLLDRAGYIVWADAEERRSRVMMNVSKAELYNYRLGGRAERLLGLLLRTCTGIFSEFVSFDEDELARQTGTDVPTFRQLLVELARMNVLRYIPRTNLPMLTFARRRVDREDIVLPDTIYADRKREMQQRIETMVGYLMTDECRSRYLLRYFGEKDARECGHCDNCTGAKPVFDTEDVRRRILHLYEEKGDAFDLTAIHFTDIPDSVVAHVLHQLMEEELLRLPQPYKEIRKAI